MTSTTEALAAGTSTAGAGTVRAGAAAAPLGGAADDTSVTPTAAGASTVTVTPSAVAAPTVTVTPTAPVGVAPVSPVDAAAAHADAVDAEGRFPVEAVDALRAAGLLGALVPESLGGPGIDLEGAAGIVRSLGRVCSSAGMVYAMHLIQVAALVRHGDSTFLRSFQRRVAAEQLLLASSTTELATGGDTSRSFCHVAATPDGDIALSKTAPVISYGAYADAVLVTARRSADAAPSDQVLLVCERGSVVLEETSVWDTLGMRGTCSNGYLLDAVTTTDHLLTDPYATISSSTMFPVSHILWGALWLGMAEAAEAKARKTVQVEARKRPDVTPPSALRLAELEVRLLHMRESVYGLLRRYAAAADDEATLSSPEFSIAVNSLKVATSRDVVAVVSEAMLIVGINAYRNGTKDSLGRLLRDAYSASLMIANDRVLANNAATLLTYRD